VKSEEGTLGKFIMKDSVYDNIEEITVDVKEMVKDLKHNPWKLLHKPREVSRTSKEQKSKGTSISTR